MTPDDTFTGLVEQYLEEYEGATPLPAHVREAVRVRIRGAARGRSERRLALPFGAVRAGARFALGAAVILIAVVIGVGLVLRPWSGPASSATTPPPSPATDLGVFEAARGRVLIRDGGEFHAIDPARPGSVAAIDYAQTGSGVTAMPAGWSADGSKLAVTDEENGALYTMAGTGTLTRVPTELVPEFRSGCCSFTTTAWLSPDGTQGLVGAGSGNAGVGALLVLDLDDIRLSHRVGEFGGTAGMVTQDPMAVWSPDGSRAAYVWSKGGRLETPAISILDFSTGASRELVSGWGLIRHLAWSPDGSQLLVVAGRDAPSRFTALNPMTHGLPADLVLVDLDDAEVHDVASGSYVAAAWSPDGSRIAAIDFPGTRTLVVLEADGSGDRQLLAEMEGSDLFTGVVWNPARPR
jgi:Tol biopolymer transport system component